MRWRDNADMATLAMRQHSPRGCYSQCYSVHLHVRYSVERDPVPEHLNHARNEQQVLHSMVASSELLSAHHRGGSGRPPQLK